MNRRLNFVFRKNFLTVSVYIIIMAAIAIMLFVSQNIYSSRKEIRLIESNNTGRVELSLKNTLEQVALSCRYFSNEVILSDPSDTQSYSANVNLIKKQAEVVFNTCTAVQSIRVETADGTFKYNIGEQCKYDLGKCYGKIGDVKLYECRDEVGTNLVLAYETDESLYGRNNVYFALNSRYVSDTVLNPDNNEYIIDKDGKIVVSNRYRLLGEKLSKVYGENFRYKEGETLKLRLNDGKYFVYAKDYEDFDLRILSVSKTGTYTPWQNNLVILSLVTFLVISSIIIAYVIIRTTYRPIEEILQKVGDMAYMEDETYNEIQYVSDKFRRIESSNRELSDIVDEKVDELTKQHIAALQAQICPHFTYNTLDTINWIAFNETGKRNNDISVAVRSLSELFRSSMDINEIFRSVREEIEFTKLYINIIHIRRKNVFDIEWNVDESLLDYSILKLSIQPLIENISLHAVDDAHPKVKINISIQPAGDDRIKVIVSDDGAGIEQQKLHDIRSNINNFFDKEHNIGLKNVNERLQLVYGEDSQLYISSISGNGTVCTFTCSKFKKSDIQDAMQ